jgi:hypothetical protein
MYKVKKPPDSFIFPAGHSAVPRPIDLRALGAPNYTGLCCGINKIIFYSGRPLLEII